jgi:DnaJ-class molecular chaperone
MRVECPECEGKKHVVIDDFAITCPTCKGEGEVFKKPTVKQMKAVAKVIKKHEEER